MIAERVRKAIADWASEQAWASLQESATEEGRAGVPTCQMERPAEDTHGDYATAICMQLARIAKQSPRALAEQLRERLLADPGVAGAVETIEVAGPGFLNFTLSRAAYNEAMTEMLAQGDEIGRGAAQAHPRVNLEFVSVNPNGPLHVGHGRYAAYGDALQRLLTFSGMNVATEFYINDHGRQMDRFGRSVAARYAQSFGLDLPVPDDGYQGEYVKDVAAAAREEVGDRYLEALRLVVAGRVTSAVEAPTRWTP